MPSEPLRPDFTGQDRTSESDFKSPHFGLKAIIDRNSGGCCRQSEKTVDMPVNLLLKKNETRQGSAPLRLQVGNHPPGGSSIGGLLDQSRKASRRPQVFKLASHRMRLKGEVPQLRVEWRNR